MAPAMKAAAVASRFRCLCIRGIRFGLLMSDVRQQTARDAIAMGLRPPP